MAYQWASLIMLSGCLLLSALHWTYFWSQRKHPIQLKSDSEPVDPFEEVVQLSELLQYTPVDEGRFWKHAFLYKCSLGALLALLSGIHIVRLVLEPGTEGIATLSLQLVVTVYVLMIDIVSILHNNASLHWPTILHIAGITGASSGALALFLIPLHQTLFINPTSELTYTFQTASLALTTLAFLLSTAIPRGPTLSYNPLLLYSPLARPKISEIDALSASQSPDAKVASVCEITQASLLSTVLFSFAAPLFSLKSIVSSPLEILDLPVVPLYLRAGWLFEVMRAANLPRHTQSHQKGPRKEWWWKRQGSGWPLLLSVFNTPSVRTSMITLILLEPCLVLLYYGPHLCLQMLIKYLEEDPQRLNPGRGWLYCAGLFVSSVAVWTMHFNINFRSNIDVQIPLRVQLNSALFSKTLLRKDIVSSTAESKVQETDEQNEHAGKARIMNLFTTDVDKIESLGWHFLSMVGGPLEVVIATSYLYWLLLGSSAFVGLAVMLILLPINHYASNIVTSSTNGLMTKRDQRVGLMNELLGAIRMLKFMTWERKSEARVVKIRSEELKYQRRAYFIEVCLNGISSATPILTTIVAFWHYTVVRGQELSPSTAFTSLAVLNEVRFVFAGLPEIFINILQGFVSLRRVEEYLIDPELVLPDVDNQVEDTIILRDASITWPRDAVENDLSSSGATRGFVLQHMTAEIPKGKMTLVCGRLGSGKTLLLLGLLGEADVISGQLTSPRTPSNALSSFTSLEDISPDEWVLTGICAYVPQMAWLLNASIKENILFGLPMNEDRYVQTLEVCALVSDLEILEDGDESEIGERGINLSGGQKARISLARAVYSRASVLLLDDVLSAVDAHTARQIFDKCLKGPLLAARTVVLVSHHVKLCISAAAYVIALDNGRVQYTGDPHGFMVSGLSADLEIVSAETTELDASSEDDTLIEDTLAPSKTSNTTQDSSTSPRTTPRKLVRDETRTIGRVKWTIWKVYLHACGGWKFWTMFILAFLAASGAPVFENGFLRYWSSASDAEERPLHYVFIYAAITLAGVLLQTIRWLVLYKGSINASMTLYKGLLESVLFANIRFHDTVSRGVLLNRFGKDFEIIDSNQARTLAQALMAFLDIAITFITVILIGGPLFLLAAAGLGVLYWKMGRVYSPIARELQRLGSVTKSPLYAMYGEVISGLPVLRAFGATTQFMQRMLRNIDTVPVPFFWTWSVSVWLSIRFNLLASTVAAFTGAMLLLNPKVDAATAGFVMIFASGYLARGMALLVHRVAGLEQNLVALERIYEFSTLEKEGPEFIEPHPAANWPSEGNVTVKNLSVRYAPDLPDVLHDLNFEVEAGSKIGILGRTGGGKSSLALSFFRFITASKGQILIDGVDIANLGLTELRSRLTIIPQEPTILSGTLRYTIDVFDEYDDVDIVSNAHILANLYEAAFKNFTQYKALRRVHLIPQDDYDTVPDVLKTGGDGDINAFRNLDSSISEGGENLSVGQKQLLAMARAILKKSKILFMDEATASVDQTTDELITQTLKEAFADSTVLTIAHRLRTVIGYDKVLVLDQGRIVEYDQPHRLLQDHSSAFYALCEATGEAEFTQLKQAAAMTASLAT